MGFYTWTIWSETLEIRLMTMMCDIRDQLLDTLKPRFRQGHPKIKGQDAGGNQINVIIIGFEQFEELQIRTQEMKQMLESMIKEKAAAKVQISCSIRTNPAITSSTTRQYMLKVSR